MTRKEYLPFGKPNFSDKEIAAVTRVLRSGWIGMGQETLTFERELGEYIGVPYIVTVNSCTSALFLSLLVCGVGPNDEVICPSLTWCSTANAALYLGAKPVFCDIDRDTLCITPASVLKKITSRTKAIMVVHFGGLAVDVDKIRAVVPKNIVIIEDAAHAFGARFPNGKRLGSSGNITCFSFYANKNCSTGEGGALALFDSSLAERLQSLRQHALPLDAWKRFTQPQALLLSNQLTELGYKMNYTDLQASLGRVQLSRQGEFVDIRLAIAKRYMNGLKDLKLPVRFQMNCLHPYHARHLFVVQLPLEDMSLDRDQVLLALRSQNIGASIHYAPLHQMPLYHGNSKPVSLRVTEQVAKCILTLPISASMNLHDADYVVKQFKETVK